MARTPLRTVGLAVALVLACSACGDSDPSASPTSTPTTTQPTTAEPTTMQPASETTSTQQQPNPGEPAVTVWFSSGDGSDCSEVTGFTRDLSTGGDPIGGAFDQLVAGPTTAERDQGATSFWSAATSEVVQSTYLQDGRLIVDFEDLRPLLPNASTSCGSEALLAGLNSTTFQFPEIDRVRYTIDGSCDTFANWLQRECVEFTSGGQAVGNLTTNERANGSGCTPSGDDLGTGRWFGYVTSASAADIEFDLACWFIGTAAVDAAAEDGEESPPPNDYYVRNASDRVRQVAVQADTRVVWLPEPGDPSTTTEVSYDAWVTGRSSRLAQLGVWLTTVDGVVTAIEEQFVP